MVAIIHLQNTFYTNFCSVKCLQFTCWIFHGDLIYVREFSKCSKINLVQTNTQTHATCKLCMTYCYVTTYEWHRSRNACKKYKRKNAIHEEGAKNEIVITDFVQIFWRFPVLRFRSCLCPQNFHIFIFGSFFVHFNLHLIFVMCVFRSVPFIHTFACYTLEMHARIDWWIIRDAEYHILCVYVHNFTSFFAFCFHEIPLCALCSAPQRPIVTAMFTLLSLWLRFPP